MSATATSFSPLLESLLAGTAQLSRDEKVVLVEKLGAELADYTDCSDREIKLGQERLRLFEEGLSLPVPWEEAKARLNLKWGKK